MISNTDGHTASTTNENARKFFLDEVGAADIATSEVEEDRELFIISSLLRPIFQRKPPPRRKPPAPPPTRRPTPAPTRSPTSEPTVKPTLRPTLRPSLRPTSSPTTKAPSSRPTFYPTAPTALPCPRGTFGEGGANCLPCPPNTVSRGDQKQCTPCTEFTEANPTRDECLLISTKGQTVPCPAGFFGTGDFDCKACPSGEITPSSGLQKCVKCPSGRISSPSRTRCVPVEVQPQSNGGTPCPPGFFGRGGIECEVCPIGQIAQRPGRRRCKICTPKRTSNMNHTRCIRKRKSQDELCKPGYFGLGGSACRLCPEGSIAKRFGRRKCKVCPLNRISNEDRTKCVSPRRKKDKSIPQ